MHWRLPSSSASLRSLQGDTIEVRQATAYRERNELIGALSSLAFNGARKQLRIVADRRTSNFSTCCIISTSRVS
jgi:hypothetical protein